MDFVFLEVMPNELLAIETLSRVYETLYPEEASYVIQERTQIIVTDDFVGKLRELSSPDEIDHYETYGWPEDLNAITLISRDEKAGFTILVMRSCFTDDTYQHTVPHEVTHVSDYTFLFERFGNLYAASEEEKTRHRFWAYYHWSEFHAKGLGSKLHAIIKAFGSSGKWPEDGKFQFAYVDFQTKYLIDLLKGFERSWSLGLLDTNERFWRFLQGYMGYLGRISAFQASASHILPDRDFPEKKLVRAFGKEILDISPILLEMTTARKALAHLRDLNSIIEGICVSLNMGRPLVTPWM